MENHKYPTTVSAVKIKTQYPIVMGATGQPSSRADGSGVSQQFIDRRLQKELSVSRTTLGPGTDGKCRFGWRMTFYTHPGMRREIPVRSEDLSELVDYVHALAVGVAPMDRLDQRIGDWCAFHTFGFGGMFADSRDALTYLKQMYFSWESVAKNIEAYGIETHPVPVKTEVK